MVAAAVRSMPSEPWLKRKPDSVLAGCGTRELYTFDLAGRLLEAVVDGVAYRRGLDGRVLEKQPLPEPDGLVRRRRRLMEPEQATELIRRAYRVLHRALGRHGRELPGELVRRLGAASPETLAEDARRFREIWAPVPVLPPDQYLAVVVQPTVGCSWGRCTFCSFYFGRPFRLRGLEEFRRHLAAIREFFGPGLGRRQGVFLGDANALALPDRLLWPYLEAVRETFSASENLREWASFVDSLHAFRRGPSAWHSLAQMGLRRVYIGLESGSDAVLRFLDKPGTAGQAVQAVHALHQAGIAVGVMVMVGPGGDRFAGEHVARTVEVVNAMELGPGDMLFLSPLVVTPDSPYARRAAQLGVRALSAAELADQARALLEGIRLGRGARWTYYHVEEFVY